MNLLILDKLTRSVSFLACFMTTFIVSSMIVPTVKADKRNISHCHARQTVRPSDLIASKEILVLTCSCMVVSDDGLHCTLLRRQDLESHAEAIAFWAKQASKAFSSFSVWKNKITGKFALVPKGVQQPDFQIEEYIFEFNSDDLNDEDFQNIVKDPEQWVIGTQLDALSRGIDLNEFNPVTAPKYFEKKGTFEEIYPRFPELQPHDGAFPVSPRKKGTFEEIYPRFPELQPHDGAFPVSPRLQP